jgi:hypothetical protein
MSASRVQLNFVPACTIRLVWQRYAAESRVVGGLPQPRADEGFDESAVRTCCAGREGLRSEDGVLAVRILILVSYLTAIALAVRQEPGMSRSGPGLQGTNSTVQYSIAVIAGRDTDSRSSLLSATTAALAVLHDHQSRSWQTCGDSFRAAPPRSLAHTLESSRRVPVLYQRQRRF